MVDLSTNGTMDFEEEGKPDAVNLWNARSTCRNEGRRTTQSLPIPNSLYVSSPWLQSTSSHRSGDHTPSGGGILRKLEFLEHLFSHRRRVVPGALAKPTRLNWLPRTHLPISPPFLPARTPIHVPSPHIVAYPNCLRHQMGFLRETPVRSNKPMRKTTFFGCSFALYGTRNLGSR